MKRFELIFMVLQVPVDLMMLVCAGVSAYYLRFTDWALQLKPVLFDLTAPDYMLYVVQVAPVWIVIYALTGLYVPHANRRFANDVVRIVLGSLAGMAFIALYIVFAEAYFDSRFLIVATTAFAICWVIIGRLALRGLKSVLYRSGIGLRRVVIIGADEIAQRLKKLFSERKELGYDVVASYNTFSPERASSLLAKRIDEILLTNPRSQETAALAALEFAAANHIGLKYSADLFSTLSANAVVHPLGGIPIVEVRPSRLEGWGWILKRLFDIIGGLFLALLFTPFRLLGALATLIETGRPLIYKNERVGLRGTLFETLKLRSMYQKDSTGKQFGASGAEALQRERELIKKQNSKKGPIYKIQDDPRVTKVGRFIRRYSIDEMPQIWNVLKGNMSIVGPRPHQLREVDGYDKAHRVAFSVKPGITGLAQISGRSDLTYEEEMRLDVLYIERWSVWLDLIILIKTPFVLLRRRKVD